MSNNEHDKNMYSPPLKKQHQTFTHVANNIAYEKDVEYMKQLYPAALKYIQAEVDEQCDKLEYAGSVMFDEYPDKNHLRMIVDTILQKIKSNQGNDSVSSKQNINLVESASLNKETVQTADSKTADSTDKSSDYERLFCLGPNCGGGPGPWGPGPWRPGPGPWRPWPGRPPRPWRPGPPPPPHRPWGGSGPWRGNCGPFCPYASQPCGEGKYCPPEPYPDLKEDGSPDWLRHLVENMLSNEMNYRRNRYRAKNL